MPVWCSRHCRKVPPGFWCTRLNSGFCRMAIRSAQSNRARRDGSPFRRPVFLRQFDGRRLPTTALAAKSTEHGFVLVLTLVVILALSIATELMTRWVSHALDQALTNR